MPNSHALHRWTALLNYCSKHGIKIVYKTNKELLDYEAMNPQAAKAIGFKMPPNEIWINKSSPIEKKIIDLEHELIEKNLMAHGYKYWPAHVIATRREHERCKRFR